MQQVDGSRIVKKGLAQDCPAVNGRLVKRSLRDHLRTDQFVVGCEVDEPRFFVIERGEVVVQEPFSTPARGDDNITAVVFKWFHCFKGLR